MLRPRTILTIILAACALTVSPAANAQEVGKRTAEEIYNKHCTTCHATAVANAPLAHNVELWKARNKTVAQFLESSKTGLNAMPPKGLCMDCTDDELKSVIEFMQSEKK